MCRPKWTSCGEISRSRCESATRQHISRVMAGPPTRSPVNPCEQIRHFSLDTLARSLLRAMARTIVPVGFSFLRSHRRRIPTSETLPPRVAPFLWLLVLVGAVSPRSRLPYCRRPGARCWPDLPGRGLWAAGSGQWRAPDVPESSQIHPAALASLQLAISLLAFPADRPSRAILSGPAEQHASRGRNSLLPLGRYRWH